MILFDPLEGPMGHLYQGTYIVHDGTKRYGLKCTLMVAPEGERLEGENPSVVLGRSGTVDKTDLLPSEPKDIGETESEVYLLWDEDLDMLFNSECTLCSGPAGWDGRTMIEDGDMGVGQKCTHCSQTFWSSDGALREHFEKTPPTFTPGRKNEPRYAVGPTRQLTER